MKYFLIIFAVLVLILAGGSVYYYLNSQSESRSVVDETDLIPGDEDIDPTEGENDNGENETLIERDSESSLGQSVGGRNIVAYHFGQGEDEILLVGGVHGGYSWNTTLLAYGLIDHFNNNPNSIPDNITVTVIPVLNPDGLEAVVGTAGRFAAGSAPTAEASRRQGRFNANGVDLNRNFDCEWQAEGRWRDEAVSGGSAAFSEPEAAALRDYVTRYQPKAAVVWYSAAGEVYASQCGAATLPETRTLTSLIAEASGYPAQNEFDYYTLSGDLTNWLAKLSIPAVSILLSDHQNTELSRNQAAVEALLQHYAN